MCGIAGFIDHKSALGDADLRQMQSALRHRGPDDQGLLIYPSGRARIGLAHTRLSILDLSAAGHQPMQFQSLSIVFNGEIYNFREIRADLQARGHSFETECDTEVILHAFSEWGINCLERFIGMFAFALHDVSEGKMYFVRDRAGVKPLYIHRGTSFWLFGSELKALKACEGFAPTPSLSAIGEFFRYGYIPDEQCVYEDCFKVDAGTYWVVDTDTLEHQVVRWWDQTSLYALPRFGFDFEEAIERVEALLVSACDYRMVADVPVGVFLSGGYDSTAVTALLQGRASKPIKTFTIGFTEGNDEAPAARAIASELGTDHHEFYCSPKDALEMVPMLPDLYDEPFADSSAIPTTLVSRLARKHVTVALSADGGDELFGGYVSYPNTARRMNALGKIPRSLRGGLSRALGMTGAALPSGWHQLRHKLRSVANSLHESDRIMAQRLHVHSRQMPQTLINELLPGLSGEASLVQDRPWPASMEELDACLGVDYQTYLKDDILTKVDRATMSVGLEGREPLLDHRLAEMAARLPMEYKYNGLVGKRVLKAIVHRHVPSALMDRPKSGFSLPIMKWLREDLRGLLGEVCSDAKRNSEGLLNSQAVDRWLRNFDRGRFHYEPLIWRLFVFQLWRARWL